MSQIDTYCCSDGCLLLFNIIFFLLRLPLWDGNGEKLLIFNVNKIIFVTQNKTGDS